MIEFLDRIDQEIFLYLNGFHNEFCDRAMIWITIQETWYPFYALILVWMFWKFRTRAFLPLLFIVLAITISDQFTSTLMKPLFERLRPCHNPEIQHLVNAAAGCGGQYGFASGHAANSFALATLLFLFYRQECRYWGLMFLWAAVVAYSRIYLGVHYPGDIFAGAVVGIGTGSILYLFYMKFPPRLRIRDEIPG
jgi:undecaprenyl-diphosphatase